MHRRRFLPFWPDQSLNRKRGGLRGSDVFAYCAGCEGPIFNQSKNAKPMTGRRIDGSPKMRHAKCPNGAADERRAAA